MAPWHRMPGPTIAVRRAVMGELRAVFAALRATARLLQSPDRGPTVRSLARTVEAAVARGERALNRLDWRDR